VFTKRPLVYPVQKQKNPFSTPHLFLHLQNFLFPTLRPLKIAGMSDTPHSCYMPIRFYLLNLIGPVMFVGEYRRVAFYCAALYNLLLLFPPGSILDTTLVSFHRPKRRHLFGYWCKMLFYTTKNKAVSRISPRRSLLSECYTFAGYPCKCNFMHVHEESVKLLCPIATKRTNVHQHFVQVSCTEFHQNRTINLQSIYRYLFAPLSKVVPVPRRFSRRAKLRNRLISLFHRAS